MAAVRRRRRPPSTARGQAGNVETTAMATLALLNVRADAGTVRGALPWLIAQKDASRAPGIRPRPPSWP